MNDATQLDDLSIQGQAGTDQYLTFILAGEEYGVDIMRVQEIRGWESATSIPNTPDFILGVINLRGAVVPIIDLRSRFGLESAEFSRTTVVIVVKIEDEAGDRIMGMVVDAVSEVYNVSEDMLREAPDLGGAINTDFVKGLATVDEKMIILLDVDLLIKKGVLENIEDAEEI
ncbi:MAG: chemotaxis protein CheW [Gammaproteobacteria bacterium]